MKPPRPLYALAALVLTALSTSAFAQSATPAAKPDTPREWWHGGWPKPPPPNPQAKLLPLIRVLGNRFVNPAGETVLFRGVSIADPDKLNMQGHLRRALFEHLKEMGVMLVRLPVHPAGWRACTPKKYLELLDQIVAWCTELGIYVDIDWHSIGNLRTELFQDATYDTTRAETGAFWRTIAWHFKGHNTVAFYELFNEPTSFRGRLGRGEWADWRATNEDLIALIRSMDTETIPLVAAFDWAYDLTPIIEDPVRATGIGYVTHPYPNKRSQPWEPRWEENFAFAAKTYPVIATEFGFDLKEGETVDDNHYGNRITRFLEGHGISWVAWDYDPEWGPCMLKSWDTWELTGFGAFIKQALQRPVAGPIATTERKAGDF